MNEIEVQKLLIKEAFNKGKALPDFGGLSDDQTIKLRNYIWKVCGSLDQPNSGSKTADAAAQMPANKKNALVTLYRLWSAFTKNIRYIVDQKGNSVSLARFGTFSRSSSDAQSVIFIPSSELAK